MQTKSRGCSSHFPAHLFLNKLTSIWQTISDIDATKCQIMLSAKSYTAQKVTNVNLNIINVELSQFRMWLYEHLKQQCLLSTSLWCPHIIEIIIIKFYNITSKRCVPQISWNLWLSKSSYNCVAYYWGFYPYDRLHWLWIY